jgi:hypothetical protein
LQSSAARNVGLIKGATGNAAECIAAARISPSVKINRCLRYRQSSMPIVQLFLASWTRIGIATGTALPSQMPRCVHTHRSLLPIWIPPLNGRNPNGFFTTLHSRLSKTVQHDNTSRICGHICCSLSAVYDVVILFCKFTSSQIAAGDGQHDARNVRGFISRKKEDRRHLFVECAVALRERRILGSIIIC